MPWGACSVFSQLNPLFCNALPICWAKQEPNVATYAAESIETLGSSNHKCQTCFCWQLLFSRMIVQEDADKDSS